MTRPRSIWIIAFVIGVAAAVVAAITGILGFLFVLLIVPGLRPRTLLIGLSGVLTGFGGTWLILLARQASAGGILGSDLSWLVGIIPLVVGIVCGSIAVVRSPRA